LRFPGAALKPNDTLPPAGIGAFQARGRNCERWPLRLWVASHTLLGEVARSMASVQALIGAEVVFTNFTEPVSPLPQSEETRNSTRTPLLMKSASGEEAVGGSGAGVGEGEFAGVGEGMGVGAGGGGEVSPERDPRISPGWSPPGEATKPKSTCPPAGIVEFQPEWLTVLVFPFRDTSLAFQIEEMAEGMVIWTDQSSMAAEPVFLRTTDPLNPDPQSESIRVVATSEAKEWAAVSARATAAMVQV
jgi:hypothetical protein